MAGGAGGGSGLGIAGAAVGTFGSMLSTAGNYLNRPKKRDLPSFTKNERRQLRGSQQTSTEGRNVIEQGAGQYQLLNPTLYELAGLEPIYTDNTAQLRQAEDTYQQTLGDLMNAQGQLAGLQADRRGAKGTKNKKAVGKQIKDLKKNIANLQGALPNAERQAGYWRTQPITITGFNKRQQSAEEMQQQQVQDQLSGKVLAGLQGNLPDDPRLLRQLAEEERVLREDLQRRLGPEYMTSTPGMQALANFTQRKAEALNDAQRRDVLAYRGLQLGGDTTLSNLTSNRMRQVAGVPTGNVGFGNTLFNMAGDYQSLMRPYTDERFAQFNQAVRNDAVPSDWAAGLLVSGEGHQQAAAAMGAGAAPSSAPQQSGGGGSMAPGVGGNSPYGPYQGGYSYPPDWGY